MHSYILKFLFEYQVPGNSGVNPERSRHCNPKTGLRGRELSIQVTVPEWEWEGRQSRVSQETYLIGKLIAPWVL